MKKNILLRTNLLICIVIIIGFLLISILGYRENYHTSLENIEQVSTLTSEGIYHQLNSIFSKPVNVSQAMAGDSLLRELLLDESGWSSDPRFIKSIQNYLSTYKKKYNYDTVFLVSNESGKYYDVNGLDRVLKEGAPEDAWYFHMLRSKQDFTVSVDKDDTADADKKTTIFVNSKIKDSEGNVLGIVGVGLRTGQIQKVLRDYRVKFGVNAYLINSDGTIEVSINHTGLDGINIFGPDGYGDDVKDSILNWKKETQTRSLWADGAKNDKEKNYIITKYLPELQWHLVAERDVSGLISQMNGRFAVAVGIIALIVAIVLVIVTRVIRGFNRCLRSLPESVEAERRCVFEKATEQLFEKVYELDVTNNKPANKATEDYFIKLGASEGMSYYEAMRIVAEKQIKEEFREGYLTTFCPENVLRVFEKGQDTLRYEFMILNEGGIYYWMRIIARIVRWQSDGSIHMLTYRQNIDAEKRQEQRLRELALRDEMTGLLTKTAIERQIRKLLQEDSKAMYAFFIVDIDHFKDANDMYGHAFGDSVIRVVASVIRSVFGKDDLLGRMGGDEFVAFIPITEKAWAEHKAAEMLEKLDRDHFIGERRWRITVSIGVAAAADCGFETFYKYADEALYHSKKGGRNRYTVHNDG